MWQKIKCWFGRHEYIKTEICSAPDGYDCTGIKCSDCDYCLVCKHCGAIKK